MGAAALALLAMPGFARAQQPAPAQPGMSSSTTTRKTTVTTQPAAPAPRPAVDPAAIAALNRMGSFLRAQNSMAIYAELSTDEVTPAGQKIKHEGTAQLEVRRPDRLRANILTDRKNEQLYYDGQNFTIFQPALGYYASFKAPPTLHDLVQVAEERYGIDMPLADLFRWGTAETRVGELKSASYVGVSTVKGAKCDHYAFRQADVDWEVCIQQGAQPLPLKLVITTSNEQTQPQHVATMSWQLQPTFEDQRFQFTPPAGAQRIEFDMSQGRGL
jgi:hypothetical protein